VGDTKTPEQIAGERIKELRLAHHWTQASLARAMRTRGYNWLQTTAAKTEAAERPLRLNEATDLARVLGVQVCDLLETGPAAREVDRRVVTAEANLRITALVTAAGRLLEVADSVGLTDTAHISKDSDG
jgi:transcriptional regulator with XRE-family HTH domain